MQLAPTLRRVERLKYLLRFFHVLAIAEASAPSKAQNVRINCKGRLAEGLIQYHGGGLVANAGQ